MEIKLICPNQTCLHLCSHSDHSCPNCDEPLLNITTAVAAQDISTNNWVDTGQGFIQTSKTLNQKPHPLADPYSINYIFVVAELLSYQQQAFYAEADKIGAQSEAVPEMRHQLHEKMFWWAVKEFKSEDSAFVYLSLWLKCIYFQGGQSNKGAQFLSAIAELVFYYHIKMANNLGYNTKKDLTITAHDAKWEIAKSIAPMLKSAVPISLAYDNPVIDYVIKLLDKDNSSEDVYRNYLSMNTAWKNTQTSK